MRAAVDPATGTRDRSSSGRSRWRRAGAAFTLTGVVLLLHAGLLRDGDRAVGRRAAPPAPSLQVRSVQVQAVSPPSAALSEVPAGAAPVTRARPVATTGTVARAPGGAVAPPKAAAGEGTAEHLKLAATSDTPPADAGDVAAPPPLPVYATRVPGPTQLRYEVRRGASTTEAIVDWQVTDGAYRLRLQTRSPQGKPIEQLSEGGFDVAGLAPVRLADRSRGRGTQAANFDRDQARISFSGPRRSYALEPGTQDRLSWMVQLSAIGAAGAVVEGAELALQVVGARGASSRWRFGVDRAERLVSPLGTVQAWHLLREPEHLYDLRIEVWLDPQRGWWPVRLRQTQVPGGEPVDWWLVEEPVAPGGT